MKTKKKTPRKYLYAATFVTGEVAAFAGHPIVENTAGDATEHALERFDASELGKPIRYVLESSVRTGGR